MSRQWLLTTLLVCFVFACGDDGEGKRAPVPTALPSPTAVFTAVLSATATPSRTPPAPTPTTEPTAQPSAAPTASAQPTPTATLEPTPVPSPRAVAKRITDPSELIGGPLAVGRVGDYLLANDRIRVIISDAGRSFSFLLTYGGNIVDADVVRAPGEPGRDNFGAMTPLINIASTVNVTEVTVVNDGENGEPAVIRATGVDDLFDPIDPANAVRAIGVGALPPSAQDVDIPAEIYTEYTLAPDATSIRIETVIKNTGSQTLRLYIGDYLNGSGELDTFGPPLGFADSLLRLQVPYFAFEGVGAAHGVSYGILPQDLASSVGVSGVNVYLLRQSLLAVLLGQEPGALSIAPQRTGSFVRHFAVTGGDTGSISDEYRALRGEPTGTVHGTVTAGGIPVEGAAVAILQPPSQGGASVDVITVFHTGPDGRYRGTLAPGSYTAAAQLAGHAYDSGGPLPAEHPITIAAGDEIEQNFALPAAGALHVSVRDENGEPIPAKVSVVGLPTARPLANVVEISTLRLVAYAFGSPIKQKGSELFGLAAVEFAGASGEAGPVALEPGEYEVVVTHGPEYSAHRERVQITAGETAAVTARVARVVDTSGFVSTDYHVHLIHSPDSNVTREERIVTMAAEGVDYFVASDHDFRTDLSEDIVRIGLAPFTRSVTSDEITTFNQGHFNAWPLTRVEDSRTGGALDWGRAGVAPGRDYPSLGSYDLSLAELFAEIPPGSVTQINHINDAILGCFDILGIDTAQNPPQSTTPPARIRQNPAITNLYDDRYTALELWITGSRGQTALLAEANFGDWFHLLNQGRRKTATADSDTHTTAVVQAGGPRNFVASSSDVPADLDHLELANNLNDGRSFASNAPFVRFSLLGDGEQRASLALGAPTIVSATGGAVRVRVNVQSPAWADFDTIDLYVNTAPVPVPAQNFHGGTTPRYRVSPQLTLRAGTDFELRRVTVNGDLPGAERFEADVEVPLAVTADTWVVVVVRGTDGVSHPLWPMNPQDLNASTNQTLDQLTDGNLGEGGVPAFAFTNPLFVDADGNGRYDAPAGPARCGQTACSAEELCCNASCGVCRPPGDACQGGTCGGACGGDTCSASELCCCFDGPPCTEITCVCNPAEDLCVSICV